MAADVVLAVVETDLRLLAAEAKKAEGPMTNLMGMLHHSDLPAVKDATERALQKIRNVEHGGLLGVQQALEILAPFVLACDTKYAKLACIAISSFQKLLANDAVSIRGRCEIIKALQAAERLSDESVKLRILQASLTIIQSPSFADEQDAIQQLLSLIFRLYLNNKSNFAVHSTAAATIRQAVALVFDHSVLKPRGSATPTPTIGSPKVSSPLSAAVTQSVAPTTATPSITPLRSGYSAGSANAPGPPQPSGDSATVSLPLGGDAGGPLLGREVVPVLLLEEILGWLGGRDGKELGWIQLQQRGGNKIDRTFLLEILEGVLVQRSAAIHRLPGLVQCLRTKVGPAVSGLLDSACDRMVDPNDAVDCRLVVRCAAALVRRHHDLAPERAAAAVVRLAETAGSVGRPGAAHRWQRFMALQALKPLLADPSLLYRLYHLHMPADKAPAAPVAFGKQSSDATTVPAASGDSFGIGTAAAGAAAAAAGDAASSSGGGGGNVLPAVVRSLHEALRWYVRTSIETPEDDVVAALGNLYLQRAMGARDSVQETEAFGTNLAHGSEVVIAHLALECVLAMVAATEALTDVVVVPAEPGMPSPKLVTRDTPDVRCTAVAGLVAVLWRCVLAVCNTLLARAGHDVLVGLLVRGLQGMTYSAGALGVRDARDALLHALCSHTLLPPGEDDMAAVAAAAAAAAAQGGSGAGGGAAAVGGGAAAGLPGAAEDRSGGGVQRRSTIAATAAPVSLLSPTSTSSGPSASSSTPAPGFLTAILVDRSVSSSFRVVLTPRNIAALRSIFNLAHRLADGLGPTGWLFVVDAVNALDRILASPHTTTAAYLAETATDGEVAGVLQPMTSSVGGLTSTGAGIPAASASTGGAGAAAVALPSAAAAALDDVGVGDGSTAAQRELRILASAADQLFENTHHMSPEAVVSLLSALSEISHRTLTGLGLLGGIGAAAAAAAAASSGGAGAGGTAAPLGSGLAAAAAGASAAGGGAGSGAAAAGLASSSVGLPGGGSGGSASVPSASPGGVPVRLCALNRMVDTLLHNLWRIQDLWGIFLAHVLEVLSSNNVQVRAAAVDALDRTITSALHPDQHVPDKFTAPLPAPEDALSPGSAAAAAAARRELLPSFVTGPGSTPPKGPSAAAGTASGSGSRAPSTDASARDGTAYTPPQPPPSSHVAGADTTTAPSPPPGALAAPASTTTPGSSPFAQDLGIAAAAAAAAAASTGTPSAPGAAPAAPTNRGVQQAAQREDVQHMLLVALDSLYREGGRSPDVRHGLLRIALHVLQHHGDGLTRGWVPLLRLLEAVPRGGLGPADVRLGFQVVEILATDYLATSLPKEHVAKALDVIAKFAMQDVVLNVSLTSITMLWNVTDHLARSRGTFSKAAGATAAATAAAAATAGTPCAPGTAATSAAQAPQAGKTPPPLPRPTTVVTPTLGSYGVGSSGNSPFSSAGGGGGGARDDDSTPGGGGGGERLMSPAFAAALSFARGVPALPSVTSPQRSLQQPTTVVNATTTTTDQSSQLTQQQPRSAVAPAAAGGGASRAPGAAVGAGGAGGGRGTIGSSSSSSYPLHDLDEAESIAMLMIAFRSLKALSVDPRPEARNAAVRTLFLAVGSHGGKFPPATWQELFWCLLFDLLVTIRRVSATSSVEEAEAVELGKERGGRSVVMLVHHSRNSEQKQWDETLVLALGGAAKVVRSYLAVLSGLDVWPRAWEQLMQILGDLLASGRKGVCLASTSLLTTIMQTHGSGPLVSRDMWRQTLAALDRGVATMAAPNAPAPLQARAELLACITALSAQLFQLPAARSSGTPRPAAAGGLDGATTPPLPPAEPAAAAAAAAAPALGGGAGGASGAVPDPEQLMLVLRWLDRFARYPVGLDDTSPIHFTTIGPIQKAALGALAALPPAVAAAGCWPEVLALLCNMLRPFSTLALRQHAQQVAAMQQQRKTAGTLAPAPTSFIPPDLPPSPLPPPPPPPLPPAPPLPPSTPTATAASALDSAASASSSLSAAASSRDVSTHGGGAAVPPATVASSVGPGGVTATGSTSGGAAWCAAYVSTPEVLEARAMSPLWMARVVELLATWYRDHVSWQVRVATFPLLVAAMSECMACRHLAPTLALAAAASASAAGPAGGEPAEQLDDLWRTAARGFVTVVQSGLPSINIICSSSSSAGGSGGGSGGGGGGEGTVGGQPQQVPHSTWPALARAFQMFFLATNLPPLQQPPPEALQALAVALTPTPPAAPAPSPSIAAASAGLSGVSGFFRRISTGGSPVVTSSSDTLGGGGGSGSGSGINPAGAGVSPQPPATTAPAAAAAAAAAVVVVVLPPQRPEQVAADLEITVSVLDCLSETVLSACQHSPVEVRRALVEVLDSGAASMAAAAAAGITGTTVTTATAAGTATTDPRPYDESALPPTSRLSHVCLNKLYVLCSRGQEPPELDGWEGPAARSQLEVAQLALPVFVSRCEAILQDYTGTQQASKTSSSTTTATTVTTVVVSDNVAAAAVLPAGTAAGTAVGPASTLAPLRVPSTGAQHSSSSTSTLPAAALHDKASHVLELLAQLKVLPVVSDALLPSRPHLRFWLDVMRALRAQAAIPPPSLASAATAAAAASAASHGAGGGVGGDGSLLAPAPSSGLLSPPAMSRRSSSGFEMTSPKAVGSAGGGGGGGGSVAGDGPASVSASASTHGGPMGRPSSSSFFSRTYSSTGALLSSALGAGAGAAGGGGAGGGASSLSVAPSPKRPSGVNSTSGSGGGGSGLGSGSSHALDSRASASLPRHTSMGASAMAATSAASAPVLALASTLPALTGKLAWVKEQPHLVALYGVLVDCIGSSDPAIRAAVQGMLAALGSGVGLGGVLPPHTAHHHHHLQPHPAPSLPL